MSLDYLKVNVMDCKDTDIDINFPYYVYSLYTQNSGFKKCLEDAMLNAQNFINREFKGVSSILYGRIKSEDSYRLKCEQKDKIFDIYAFKIVINGITDDFQSKNLSINNKIQKLQIINDQLDSLKNLNNENPSVIMEEKITSLTDYKNIIEDSLYISIANDISNALIADDSSFLRNLGAKNMPNREKNYNKEESGYISNQRTIEMYPDYKIDIPCFVEFQCRSSYRDMVAKKNHSQFKKEKYQSDEFDNFPKKELYDCNNIEDFKKLCKKVPTYVFLRDKQLIQAPDYINLLHSYSNYLFEYDIDEDGNTYYVHQSELDKIKSLVDKELDKQKTEPLVDNER